MIVDVNGWIDTAARVPSVRHGELATPRPLVIIQHATSSPASAMALARRIRSYNPCKKTCPDFKKGWKAKKCGHDRPASWHGIATREGKVIQSIPFNRRAWHAGHPIKMGKRLYASANPVSIGIEWEHPGPVDGVWADYTDAQRALWPVLRDAIYAYCGGPIPSVGHYEISGPGGHNDPGKAWMDWLRRPGVPVETDLTERLKDPEFARAYFARLAEKNLS